jgi:hypothetical protein
MGKFNQAHIKALEAAITEKKKNPSPMFITDAVNAAAAGLGAGAGAAAVAALVGMVREPVDPAFLVRLIPEGGFSLEQIIKARDHALKSMR